MLQITLTLVRVELLAEQHVPVLSHFAFLLLLLYDVPIDMDAVLPFTVGASLSSIIHRQSTSTVSHDWTFILWRELLRLEGGRHSTNIRGSKCAVCHPPKAVVSHTELGTR